MKFNKRQIAFSNLGKKPESPQRIHTRFQALLKYPVNDVKHTATKLNPIEKVWNQLKWTMSPIIVQDEAEFHELVKTVFEQVTNQISFAKKWAEKFLDFQKISR